MNDSDTPAKVASNDQLGLSAEAPTLVERLRERAGQYDECGWHEKIEREAADEIERAARCAADRTHLRRVLPDAG